MENQNQERIIKAEGVPDNFVIQIAKEVATAASVHESDIEAIQTREKALTSLELIALVSARNPLLEVVKELGVIPPDMDLSLSIDLIEAKG